MFFTTFDCLEFAHPFLYYESAPSSPPFEFPEAKMRSLTITAFVYIFTCFIAHAQNNHTSLVSVLTSDPAAVQALQSFGLDMQETIGKTGGWLELPVSQTDLDRIRTSGLSYRILQENMEEAYTASVRGLGSYDALGFGQGSMGGHYTYPEIVRQLDSLKLLFPNLITAKQAIGTTLAGRTIWAVKISDNPDAQESEPEALYTALTHAREPGGMMSLLYYMWYLLQNYGTNPEAAYLVDNRQLWFVPCVNPDGYEYNRKFYPGGGGMRRKNLRGVDTTTYNPSSNGIDLNRNFGTHAMWNSPFGGSSDNTSDDTYRGTLEWSEPETAALRNFAYAHQVKVALNYHTYGNYLIYPWGHQPLETPDSVIFREYAADMTNENGYLPGRPTETVGYTVRGVSDDFFYGDPAKPKAFSMTPEVGDRFWALPQDILRFALENLNPNLYLARMAGGVAALKSYNFVDNSGDGFLNRGEEFTLNTIISNKGLGDAENVTVECTPISPYIQILTPSNAPGNLASRSEIVIPIEARVATNSPTGIPGKILFTTTDASGLSRRDTITLMIGQPGILLSDSATTLANWAAQTPWGLTTTSHSAPKSFTDSPSGTYQSNTDVSIRSAGPISLTTGSSTFLTFWTRWDLEDAWDFARVEVSINNGATWKSIHGRYTHLGSGRASSQPDTAHGLDGTQLTWVEESMDLTEYAGQSIRLRFRVTSDGSVEQDGWYVDDISLLIYFPDYDTAVVVSPDSITLNGITGTRLDQSLTIHNYTNGSLTFAIAESSITSIQSDVSTTSGQLDFGPYISKLRRSGITRPTLSPESDPLAYVTAATDTRGDNFISGVDVLELLYQKRTTFLGPVLDLRVRVINPDSNLAGFISLDSDQDFGTGIWPTPWQVGPRARDVGSEFEVLIDASGFIGDSLGLGNLPVAVVLRTTDTSLVYIPIVPSITHDSVMTITVSGIPLGVLGLNDADQNLNIGAVFARLELSSAFPDYAPNLGNGLIGSESGVSWVSTSTSGITIPSGDSAVVGVSVLAAKPAGEYQSSLKLSAAGLQPIYIPIRMNVTSIGIATIGLSATSFSDTVVVGDSTSLTLTISNSGNTDLGWGVVDTLNTSWVNIFPPLGFVNPGSSGETEITLRSSGLTPGTTHTTQFSIVSNDPSHSSIAFPISFRVDPSVSVGGSSGQLPATFALHQNYPNPFNPETRITFDLPKVTQVNLKVFDLLGREVASLADGVYQAGKHVVSFNAAHYSTGVYIYRLTAGEFVQTRLMVVVR